MLVNCCEHIMTRHGGLDNYTATIPKINTGTIKDTFAYLFGDRIGVDDVASRVEQSSCVEYC